MNFTKPIDKLAKRMADGSIHLRAEADVDGQGNPTVKIYEKRYSRKTGEMEGEEESIFLKSDIQAFTDDLTLRITDITNQFLTL